MKYRKKPVEVEAFRFGIDSMPDWFVEKSLHSGEITVHGAFLQADIKTLEGVMIAKFGDFIIKGVKGEIYPCKPDIFYATYEESEDTE